jgi:hypothetical protein
MCQRSNSSRSRAEPPHRSSLPTRMARTPKVYVRDTGLLHALLGIRNQEELLGHPVVGASLGGLLIENVLNALPATARPTFYRTSVGAEIDLVVEFSAKSVGPSKSNALLEIPHPAEASTSGVRISTPHDRLCFIRAMNDSRSTLKRKSCRWKRC